MGERDFGDDETQLGSHISLRSALRVAYCRANIYPCRPPPSLRSVSEAAIRAGVASTGSGLYTTMMARLDNPRVARNGIAVRTTLLPLSRAVSTSANQFAVTGPSSYFQASNTAR